MPEYLIYFNQQWVGDHTEEWFRGRGPLAMAVVDEIKAAGAYVFAGGLEHKDGPVFSADATSGTVLFTDGPFIESKEFLGGLTVVDVADEEAARMWAGKMAEACGWPQEGSPIQAGAAARSPGMRSPLVNRGLSQGAADTWATMLLQYRPQRDDLSRRRREDLVTALGAAERAAPRVSRRRMGLQKLPRWLRTRPRCARTRCR